MPGGEVLGAVVTKVEFTKVSVLVGVCGPSCNTYVSVRERLLIGRRGVVLVIAHVEEEHGAYPVGRIEEPLIEGRCLCVDNGVTGGGGDKGHVLRAIIGGGEIEGSGDGVPSGGLILHVPESGIHITAHPGRVVGIPGNLCVEGKTFKPWRKIVKMLRERQKALGCDGVVALVTHVVDVVVGVPAKDRPCKPAVREDGRRCNRRHLHGVGIYV